MILFLPCHEHMAARTAPTKFALIASILLLIGKSEARDIEARLHTLHSFKVVSDVEFRSSDSTLLHSLFK